MKLHLSAKPRKRRHLIAAARAAKGIISELKVPAKRIKTPIDGVETTVAESDGSKRQRIGTEGDALSEGDSQPGNEGPRSRRGKGQVRGKRTRSRAGESEDSSEDGSGDGSWISENEGRQLRFGRRARPLRQAVLASSKRSKYADSEDGESSSSSRRARKQSRLEEETIYTQAPITRASARAAAAKNKKIYAEDSDSDNQQEDGGDQGVPDDDNNARQDIERPQGTHFLDPDFTGLEDVAMDGMDTLENCLETVLTEKPHESSVRDPDSGPPESREHVVNDPQSKDENRKEPKDSDIVEESQASSSKNDQVGALGPSEDSQIETEVVSGRQLRYGRKARTAQQYTKRKRRGRRGRSNAAGSEGAEPQAEESSKVSMEVSKSLQHVGDVENTDSRVPMSAVEEEGSDKQTTENDGSAGPTSEVAADRGLEGLPLDGSDDLPKRVEPCGKDNTDEAPANLDAESITRNSNSKGPDLPKDETDPSGNEPPDTVLLDENHPSEDALKENDDPGCIPYGPKMAEPTQADIEFFRSIIPTIAKFNQHQKAILKATVLSTLTGMLGEDVGIKLNTTEALLNALPLPASPE